jgi:pyruvate dehydrogenase E1 component
MLERRKQLGGFVPTRSSRPSRSSATRCRLLHEFDKGTEGRKASTTMVFVRMLAKLLKDKELGELVGADRSRRGTHVRAWKRSSAGRDLLARRPAVRAGRHGHASLYKEAKEGQILEEGITEAGSMSSFIAAGTAYATHGINTIPSSSTTRCSACSAIGDLVWAAGDSRTRGFLLGGTAGRTTLAGEGLQHPGRPQPSVLAGRAEPDFLRPGVRLRDRSDHREGIRRMYVKGDSVFYYITVMNENYEHPPLPQGVRDGILKGMYRFKASEKKDAKARAQLLGSGAILPEVIKAARILEDQYSVAADIWSVTSYQELYREGHAAERWNRLHPDQTRRVPYVRQCFEGIDQPIIAASDYVKALPDAIDRWLPRPLVSLGTDGFGRSENRASLRDFFEVDKPFHRPGDARRAGARGEARCRRGDESHQGPQHER